MTELPEGTVRRPLGKRVMHLVRRTHLYLGLFLLPWAVLYGVTAFLFNHPTAFSDQPTATFGHRTLEGTPLATAPTCQDQADQVLAQLNEHFKPTVPYVRMGDARYTRDFAFATVHTSEGKYNVLFDLNHGGGTVRQANPDPPKHTSPPFALGAMPPAGPPAKRPLNQGLPIASPLPKAVQQSVPTVLERTGFPQGDVIVTSVPDVAFPVAADGQTWIAIFNPMTGTVSGMLESEAVKPELGWRRYVLWLHTAHGYPGDTSTRWYWALLVDVMAGVMVFWGLSGVCMWWQVKATRWPGLVVLLLSASSAAALGVAMYRVLQG